MQSILWGLELYKADLLKSQHFFMIQNKATAFLWINRAAGFRWTGISISRGFLKARSPWKMLLWTTRCWKHPPASFLQGRKCPNLFICLFLPCSLPPFSFLCHEISTRWEENELYHQFHDLSSIMENYSYLLLHMLIPLTNIYQACMSDTLPGTRQSEYNRHKLEVFVYITAQPAPAEGMRRYAHTQPWE